MKVFQLIHCNVQYCLSKIFSIYKKTLFVNGVNYLVLILSKTIDIRNDLELWESHGKRHLDDFLCEFFRVRLSFMFISSISLCFGSDELKKHIICITFYLR